MTEETLRLMNLTYYELHKNELGGNMTHEEAVKIVSDIEKQELAGGYVRKDYEDSFFWGYFRGMSIRLLIENDMLKKQITESIINQ